MTKLTKIPNFATINKEENNMKKIFLSFLLVMVGISHTLAQGLDGNVEQRLKDFFTQYETSYANIGKCKLDRYEVNHNQKKLGIPSCFRIQQKRCSLKNEGGLKAA